MFRVLLFGRRSRARGLLIALVTTALVATTLSIGRTAAPPSEPGTQRLTVPQEM